MKPRSLILLLVVCVLFSCAFGACSMFAYEQAPKAARVVQVAVDTAQTEWNADEVAPTTEPAPTPMATAKPKLNAAAAAEPVEKTAFRGAAASAVTALPTPITEVMSDEDLYREELRKEYDKEVGRREAGADLDIKGISEPREIGVTHEKSYVFHIGHATFVFKDGASFGVQWSGGENIVNIRNMVSDTVVVTVSDYPETGFTMWEYAPGRLPNLEIQAIWPIGNPAHCGYDNGCPFTMVWDASWTQNGMVLNSVTKYELVNGDVATTVMDPKSFVMVAPSAEEVPATEASTTAPVVDTTGFGCVPDVKSFIVGYDDSAAADVVLHSEQGWIIAGHDPAEVNGKQTADKGLTIVAPGATATIVGLGRDMSNGRAYIYACLMAEQPNEALQQQWVDRESNNGTRQVEIVNVE